MHYRWDICSLNDLPDYMKLCYQALLDIYKEIEHETIQEGRAYCAKYAKDKVCIIWFLLLFRYISIFA